jgi:hypothetical protein
VEGKAYQREVEGGSVGWDPPVSDRERGEWERSGRGGNWAEQKLGRAQEKKKKEMRRESWVGLERGERGRERRGGPGEFSFFLFFYRVLQY